MEMFDHGLHMGWMVSVFCTFSLVGSHEGKEVQEALLSIKSLHPTGRWTGWHMFPCCVPVPPGAGTCSLPELCIGEVSLSSNSELNTWSLPNNCR